MKLRKFVPWVVVALTAGQFALLLSLPLKSHSKENFSHRITEVLLFLPAKISSLFGVGVDSAGLPNPFFAFALLVAGFTANAMIVVSPLLICWLLTPKPNRQS